MSEALEATTFTVTCFFCAAWAPEIYTALRGLEGVSDISLHYPETTLGVLHSGAVSPAAIRETVTALGFEIAAA